MFSTHNDALKFWYEVVKPQVKEIFEPEQKVEATFDKADEWFIYYDLSTDTMDVSCRVDIQTGRLQTLHAHALTALWVVSGYIEV